MKKRLLEECKKILVFTLVASIIIGSLHYGAIHTAATTNEDLVTVSGDDLGTSVDLSGNELTVENTAPVPEDVFPDDTTISENEPEEVQPVPFQFSQEMVLNGRTITVLMHAAVGVLPVGTYAVIQPAADTASIAAEAQNAAPAETEVKQVYAVDITLYHLNEHGEAEEVTPDMIQEVDGSSVTVTFEDLPMQSTEKAEVVHVAEQGLEVVADQTADQNSVSFDAPHFSTYAVVISDDYTIKNENGTDIKDTITEGEKFVENMTLTDNTTDQTKDKGLYFLLRDNFGINPYAVAPDSITVTNVEGGPVSIKTGTEAYHFCDAAIVVNNPGKAKISFRFQEATIFADEDTGEYNPTEANASNPWNTMELTLTINGISISGATGSNTLEPVQLTANIYGLGTDGVKWNIVSGHGTVDQSGKVTLIPQTTGSEEIVVVSATSKNNTDYSAEHTITFDTSRIFTFENSADSTGIKLYYCYYIKPNSATFPSEVKPMRAGEVVSVYAPIEDYSYMYFYAKSAPGYAMTISFDKSYGHSGYEFKDIPDASTGCHCFAKRDYGCTKYFQYTGNYQGSSNNTLHRGFILKAEKSKIHFKYSVSTNDIQETVDDNISEYTIGQTVSTPDGLSKWSTATATQLKDYTFTGWKLTTPDGKQSVIIPGETSRTIDSLLDYVVYKTNTNESGTISLEAQYVKNTTEQQITVNYHAQTHGDLSNHTEIVTSPSDLKGATAYSQLGYKFEKWTIDETGKTSVSSNDNKVTFNPGSSTNQGKYLIVDTENPKLSYDFYAWFTEDHSVTKNITIDYYIDGVYDGSNSETLSVWINASEIPMTTIKNSSPLFTNTTYSLEKIITYKGGVAVTFATDAANVDLPDDVAKNISVYFTKAHKVTYHKNNIKATGSVPTDDETYKNGDVVTVKFDHKPLLENYTFLGWSENPSAQTPEYKERGNEGVNLTITDHDIDLFAVWRSQTREYIVNYVDAETHKPLLPSITVSGNYGEDITENAAYISGYKPDRAGEQFTLYNAVDVPIIITFEYTKRTDLQYTIHYFFDGTENLSEMQTVSGQPFEKVITSVPVKSYSGYTHSKTEGLPLTISGENARNYVNLYFTRNSSNSSGSSSNNHHSNSSSKPLVPTVPDTTVTTPTTEPVTPAAEPETTRKPASTVTPVTPSNPDSNNGGSGNGNSGSSSENQEQDANTTGITEITDEAPNTTIEDETPGFSIDLGSLATFVTDDASTPDQEASLQVKKPDSVWNMFGIDITDGETPLAFLAPTAESAPWFILWLLILFGIHTIVSFYHRHRRNRRVKRLEEKLEHNQNNRTVTGEFQYD